jgi:hypothetical protein
MGVSRGDLSPSASISDILSPVSGLISVTIFSKSKIIINLPSILIIPVETPSSLVETVLPGLIILFHETL